MSASDYVKYYDATSVGFFIDTYTNNYLEVINQSPSDTKWNNYTFTVPQNQTTTTWIGVDSYNRRMFPHSPNCQTSTYFNVKILGQNGAILANYGAGAGSFSFATFNTLAKGNYTISVQSNYGSPLIDFTDYTVRIYSNDVIPLKTKSGALGSFNYVLPCKNNTISGCK